MAEKESKSQVAAGIETPSRATAKMSFSNAQVVREKGLDRTAKNSGQGV